MGAMMTDFMRDSDVAHAGVEAQLSTASRVFINSARQDQPFSGWTEVQGGGTTNTAPACAAFGDRFYIVAKGIL